CADLQCEVEPRLLRAAKLKTLCDIGLETRKLRFEIVGARLETRELIRAGLVRDNGRDNTCRGIGRGNHYAGNERARRVLYRSSYGRIGRLREPIQRQSKKHDGSLAQAFHETPLPLLQTCCE